MIKITSFFKYRIKLFQSYYFENIINASHLFLGINRTSVKLGGMTWYASSSYAYVFCLVCGFFLFAFFSDNKFKGWSCLFLQGLPV